MGKLGGAVWVAMGLTLASVMAGIFAAPHWVGFVLGGLALLCFVQAAREYHRERNETRQVNWYDVRKRFKSWDELKNARIPKDDDKDV